MSAPNTSIGRIVAASTRHPWIVLFLIGGLTLAALLFTAQNFAMTADTSQLISKQLDWRQRGLAFDAAFPQYNNLTMVVVDGATPEIADDAAKRLTAAGFQVDALDQRSHGASERVHGVALQIERFEDMLDDTGDWLTSRLPAVDRKPYRSLLPARCGCNR